MRICAGGWARRASIASTPASPSIEWLPRRRPCTRAWPAQATQWTLRVRLRAAEAARVHHAEVTECKVVLHGIDRIEAPERRGDVAGHLPAGTRVARQLQAPADAD